MIKSWPRQFARNVVMITVSGIWSAPRGISTVLSNGVFLGAVCHDILHFSARVLAILVHARPGLGDPQVRFDEREVETEHGMAREAPADERAGNG